MFFPFYPPTIQSYIIWVSENVVKYTINKKINEFPVFLDYEDVT